MSNTEKAKTVGNYDILRRLPGGKSTQKFHAKDESGRHVTLIMLDREKYITRYGFEAFNDEVSIAEKKEKDLEEQFSKDVEKFKETYERVIGLSHPNIAEVYAVEYSDEMKAPFAVLEYVPGNPLFQEASKLLPLQMIYLFVKTLEGIKYIHDNNLLHLNIKSERVLADYQSDGYHVKLSDFGFAVPIDNVTSENKGTRQYVAPEVALGMDQYVGVKSDIFSFGVLMYYCLTRKFPFPARQAAGSDMARLRREIEQEPPPAPLSHYGRDIPEKLDSMVINCLKKLPDDRPFNSSDELLGHFLTNWPDECKEMPFEKTITFNTD